MLTGATLGATLSGGWEYDAIIFTNALTPLGRVALSLTQTWTKKNRCCCRRLAHTPMAVHIAENKWSDNYCDWQGKGDQSAE